MSMCISDDINVNPIREVLANSADISAEWSNPQVSSTWETSMGDLRPRDCFVTCDAGVGTIHSVFYASSNRIPFPYRIPLSTSPPGRTSTLPEGVPKTIYPDKTEKALQLYTEYRREYFAELFRECEPPRFATRIHDGYHLRFPTTPTPRSVTSHASICCPRATSVSSSSAYDGGTDLTSVMSFDDNESPNKVLSSGFGARRGSPRHRILGDKSSSLPNFVSNSLAKPSRWELYLPEIRRLYEPDRMTFARIGDHLENSPFRASPIRLQEAAKQPLDQRPQRHFDRSALLAIIDAKECPRDEWGWTDWSRSVWDFGVSPTDHVLNRWIQSNSRSIEDSPYNCMQRSRHDIPKDRTPDIENSRIMMNESQLNLVNRCINRMTSSSRISANILDRSSNLGTYRCRIRHWLQAVRATFTVALCNVLVASGSAFAIKTPDNAARISPKPCRGPIGEVTSPYLMWKSILNPRATFTNAFQERWLSSLHVVWDTSRPTLHVAACVFCTTLAVILFTIRRKDTLQKYFLITGLSVSILLGFHVVLSPEFIFKYLFPGIYLAQALSAAYHLYQDTRNRTHLGYSDPFGRYRIRPLVNTKDYLNGKCHLPSEKANDWKQAAL